MKAYIGKKFRICHGTRGVTVAHLRRIRRVLGSTPGECHFFNYFVASFLLCCPCEALEGPISTREGIILTTTLIQSRHIIIRIALLYIYIYMLI